MKIKKIIIKNFRAFDTVEIDFADFNCIIGKNDCGKSSVFAALDWFFNDKGFEDRLDVNVNTVDNFEVDNYEVSVEIEFSDTINGNPLKIAKKITIERNLKNITGTPVLEYYFNGKKYGSEEWSKFLKYDKPFNLPKFELFTPLTPIKVYLNKFLNLKNVTYDDDIETAVDEISHEVYRKTGKIELNSVYCDFFPDLNMPLFTSEGSTRIPLQNRGDGFQQIIKNAVFRLLASKSIFKENVANSLEAESKEKLFGIKQNSQPISLIFAFEEPETHLHPSAQLEMFNTIKSLSAKYQVLVTTHSPYIVKALKEEDEKKHKIIVLKRIAKKHKTTAKNLPKRVLPYASMNEINYIAFDEPSIEYHIELFGYIHNKLIERYNNNDEIKEGLKSLQKYNIKDEKIPALQNDGNIADIAFVDAFIANVNNVKTFKHKPPSKFCEWYNYDKKGKYKYEKKRTLPYCVRNWIDHPMTKRTEEKSDDDKKYNEAYDNNKNYGSPESLRESIDIMRRVITENRDIFPPP